MAASSFTSGMPLKNKEEQNVSVKYFPLLCSKMKVRLEKVDYEVISGRNLQNLLEKGK